MPEGGRHVSHPQIHVPKMVHGRDATDFGARHRAWHHTVVEPAVVELGPDTLVEGRPFTDPERSDEDASVMRGMLARLRAFARGWPDTQAGGDAVLVRRHDAAGLRTWIRIPGPGALLAAGELTTVGFFGQARADVDHAPIHRLEEGIVDTLEEVPGVLSYFNLELPDGRYGNLILCGGADVPVRWREHELHRTAVELAPSHYHSARLHGGVVRSPLLGDADLIVRRTRYLDFDSTPTWLAVRELHAR